MITLRVVLFAVSYAVFLYWAIVINSKERLAKKPLQAATLNGILVSVGFSVFVGFQIGTINPKVTLALCLLGQSGVLFSLGIGTILDLRQDVLSACVRWGAVQLSPHRRLLFGLVSLTGSALLVYPVAVIWAIIATPSDPTLFAIQCAVALVFLMFVPFTCWILWGILARRFWWESTRTQLLLLFLSGVLSTTLYFVLLLWAFGLTGTDSSLSLLGTPVRYSPRIVCFVFLGLVINYLAPYFRGVYLGRQTVKHFYEEKRSFLNRTIRVLKYPGLIEAENDLKGIQDELKAGIASFTIMHPAFALADMLENASGQPDDLKYERAAFPIARAHDMRFEHLDWARSLEYLMESARTEIAQKDSSEAKRDAIVKWIVYFEQHRSEVIDSNEASPRASALILLSIVVSTTVCAALSKAGEALWELIKETLK